MARAEPMRWPGGPASLRKGNQPADWPGVNEENRGWMGGGGGRGHRAQTRKGLKRHCKQLGFYSGWDGEPWVAPEQRRLMFCLRI